MNREDRREADQLRKLLRGPRREPLLGNGPETLRRVVDSFTADYDSGVDSRRKQAQNLTPNKEKS